MFILVSDPSVWSHIADVVPLERIWLRPALNEVFDIQWSPDSTHLVVGAIDCKVSGHTSPLAHIPNSSSSQYYHAALPG